MSQRVQDTFQVLGREKKPYPLPDSPNGYWRSWCCNCGEEIRVPRADIHRALCVECSGERNKFNNQAERTPRQAAAFSKMMGWNIHR